MLQMGRIQRLPVWTISEAGALLGDRDAHVILPSHEVKDGLERGEELEVFVYLDPDENRVATLTMPYAQVGEFACLDVVGANDHGVFLDWGMDKDLFVPWKLQHGMRLEVGQRVVVRIDIDRIGRPIGVTKLSRYLEKDASSLRIGDVVDFLVYATTSVGSRGILNGHYSGMLYAERMRRPPRVGTLLKVYVQRLREDGKVDCSIDPVGSAGRESAERVLLSALRRNGGTLRLTDKSSPEAIRRTVGLSKKAFKKALGALYRQRLVQLKADEVVLVQA